MTNQFQRILIASDLTLMDQNLLSFFKQISQLSTVQKVYLIHIIPNFAQPKNKELAYHQSFTTGYPVDEKARDILAERILDYSQQGDPEFSIEVLEGNIYKKLLHLVEVKEIDLLIMGRKKVKNGSGIIPRRIARKINSHVLFVPETVSDEITDIVVPIDFSANSADALRTAIRFKQSSPTPVLINAVHVVQLLPTDYYFGLEYNQVYREGVIKQSQEAFAQFLEKHQIPEQQIKSEVIVNDAQNVALQVKAYLDQSQPDLVVLGATGHTIWESLVFGSVTERLVEIVDDYPLLIVR